MRIRRPSLEAKPLHLSDLTVQVDITWDTIPSMSANVVIAHAARFDDDVPAFVPSAPSGRCAPRYRRHTGLGPTGCSSRLSTRYALSRPPSLGNPSNLTGTAGTNLQIELTWQSAANADTQWVYQVRADGIGSGSWHQGDGSITVTGLENNVSYSFIVIATRTVDGDSEWSQWSNWVTVKAVLTLPNPPGRYEQISAGERHTCAIRARPDGGLLGR